MLQQEDWAAMTTAHLGTMLGWRHDDTWRRRLAATGTPDGATVQNPTTKALWLREGDTFRRVRPVLLRWDPAACRWRVQCRVPGCDYLSHPRVALRTAYTHALRHLGLHRTS
jgi:hypothetical protein